jgi:choline-sulfatase
MKRFFFLGILLAVPAFAQQPSRSKPSKPDIILVTIDTLRADHVRCYGDAGAQTPALDQLAKDGLLFTQAFTPSPLTNVSHTTILTGLLPISHGVTNFGVPLDRMHPTLAELLKVQGYQTAAFIGAVVLDNSLAPGLDRGFDFFDHFPQHPKQNSSRWGRLERRGKDVVSHAEKWLTSHRTAPRFVWIHLYDPHDPYEPPPPYSEAFRDRLYDGEIAYADSVLGDFIAYLKKQNWYEPALVIVTGDHGEGLGEHNEETHGIFLYDSTTHIPLIVKQPLALAGKTRSAVVTAQVRTTDIVPTVLDMLQLTSPVALDGASLEPYFASTTEPSGAKEEVSRTAFGETDYPLSFGWAPLRSVRSGDYKFIEAPHPELYDLHTDPRELHSIYEPWNSQVQTLRAELAKLREAHPAHASASPGAVGSGTTQELQALGYLGPADVASSSTVAEPSLLPDPKEKIAEQNLLHTAMLATNDARPADARAALEKVLSLDANSFAALSQIGQLELSAGNYKRAAEYFARARAMHAEDANIALKYGETLNRLSDLSGAEQAVQASLKINPNQYAARLLLGDIYFHLHKMTEAQDQLEAAVLVQSSFDGELKLGEVLLAQGKCDEAREHLLAAIGLDPKSAYAYDLLARAYTGLHKTAEASAAQNRAKVLRNVPSNRANKN